MKISARESLLAWATMVVVLLGASYLLAEPRLKEWADLGRAQSQYQARGKAARHLLAQQPEIERQLAAVRATLPAYPADQRMDTEMLKRVEQTAAEHQVTLGNRDAKPEKKAGELCEVVIVCGWEAELEALLRFLYAHQTPGASMDIRDLTVAPGPGGPGKLRGTFTVDCLYTRTAAAAAAAPAAASVPPSATPQPGGAAAPPPPNKQGAR